MYIRDAHPEVWKSITGYPYEVSNYGRVRRSEKRKAHNTFRGRLLKLNKDRYGYIYVRLCKNGKVKDFKVHALVCTSFNGPCPIDCDQVRHLNGVSYDNFYLNLEWGTALQNAEDRDRHGKTGKGQKSHRAALTNAQVFELRELYAKEKKGKKRVRKGFVGEMATKYSINKNTLKNILKGGGYNEI